VALGADGTVNVQIKGVNASKPLVIKPVIPTDAPTKSPASSSSNSMGLTTGAIAGIVVGGVVLIALISLAVGWWICRRNTKVAVTPAP
ncbi:hypothetical protein ACE4Z7_24790, partial [Salmonella enterica]|uniref:hypothetical protein n=1 Tax=Salmonella enterica TaxID=28901 RepID=UPI003D2C4567